MRIIVREHSFSCGNYDLAVRDVYRFHRGLPDYRRTPLRSVEEIARKVGIGRLLVKDEGFRFGLNAFKCLGVSYALYQILVGKCGGSLAPEELFSKKGRHLAEGMSLTCATDGNHGRAVAWAAKLLECPAVVFMPKDSVQARISAIEKEGARVIVIDGGYDEAVRRAAELAVKEDMTVIADVGYSDYTKILEFIQKGYLTIFAECAEQMAGETETGAVLDCVAVQAGVGAFASAAASFYAGAGNGPHLISVEPESAGCLYLSAEKGDGKPHSVTGDGRTIMAGLNCETPSTTAWPIIWDRFDAFLVMEDRYTERAMKMLADEGIVAGESGAAPLGALLAIYENCSDEVRGRLGLHGGASVLIVITEGDTDPEGYARIVGCPADVVRRRRK